MESKTRQREGKSAPRGAFDMSKGAPQDRFTLPKANLISNKTGNIKAIGIEDCKSRRPLTSSFESAKRNLPTADEHQKVLDSPYSPRHHAYSTYLSSVDATEVKRGNSTTTADGIARCHHTQYGIRVTASSQVAQQMNWPSPPPTARPSTSSSSGRDTPRPVTAPGGSWDVDTQQSYQVQSPRFIARTHNEAYRTVTKTAAAERERMKKESRAQYHAVKEAEERDNAVKAAERMHNWPHGLPAVEFQSAKKEEIKNVYPVGYGTPQSMKEAQYEALKSNMRMP